MARWTDRRQAGWLVTRLRGIVREHRVFVAVVTALAVLGTTPAIEHVRAAQSDLDAFMKQVLAQRDDNWKKLQQYILDEAEQLQLTGPSRAPIWGERREYTWYIRDGFFVRSPLKVNGAPVSEGDRQ